MRRLLTPRQLEIIELVAQGYNCVALRDHLGVSNSTVQRHLSRIYWILDLPSYDGPKSPLVMLAVWLNCPLFRIGIEEAMRGA